MTGMHPASQFMVASPSEPVGKPWMMCSQCRLMLCCRLGQAQSQIIHI